MKIGRTEKEKVERSIITCFFVMIKESNRLALAFAKCLATHHKKRRSLACSQNDRITGGATKMDGQLSIGLSTT